MRVIAGSLGGQRLEAPRGYATRPTSDRVREALFSVLADVTGARVLDLYAGTGALGIEALSRGAAHATFVESAREALMTLRENLARLGLGAVSTVIALPARRAVTALSVERASGFDLVFVDPPYASLADAVEVVTLLSSGRRLAEGARVVLEHASRDPAPALPGLSARPTRGYGDTSLSLYDETAAPLVT